MEALRQNEQPHPARGVNSVTDFTLQVWKDDGTAHGAVVEKYVTNPFPFMGLLLQAVQQGTKKFFDFQWKTNGKIFSRLSVSVTTDFS